MKPTKRVPLAPGQPLPALEEFLRPFHVHFARSEATHALDRYLTGMLTEHPNKNCDTLAQVVPGPSEQSLQGLLTAMRWDEDDLNRQRVQDLLALPTEGDAALVFDDTGFAKQGQSSVGVARQYSGTLGKVGNCQITVNCHYAERTISWPVASKLYLPKQWAEDKERRDKAGVPEDIKYKTKAEIALDLLDYARECGVHHKCVTADSEYGDNPNFLDGLEERDERYCVAVRCNFSVAHTRFSDVVRSDKAIEEIPLGKWETISWAEGSKGILRAKFVAVRCFRVDGRGRRRVGWLIGQRPGRDQVGEWKYYWSNFSCKSALEVMVEYAHRRHFIEQFHEEAKVEFGWDQYQGRLWTGFHRHTIILMLAYSFLVWLEYRMRQRHQMVGRPRGPFSPSQG